MSFVAAPPSQSNIAIKAFLAASSGSYINYTGSFIGDGSGLKNLPTSLAIDSYIFTGDGSTQNFVVSSSYEPRSLFVTVGGLRYINDNDYTVSSNTIQFVQPPATQSIVLIQALIGVSSGSFGTFSGSFIGTATTASYVLPSGLPPGVISSSAQINTYLDLDGVYSSSAQVLNSISGATITPGVITASGHVVPSITDTYDLGSPDKKWRSLYVSGSTIYLGSLELKDSGGTFAVVNESGDTLPVSGSFTGSFFGTSSWANNAVTASYATTAANVLKTKAGSVTNTSFGGTPLTASVTFSTAFNNTNYAIAITGEDARVWVVEGKTSSGFTINSTSNTSLSGTTYWTCTAYGEN
jgi:hypothetical protein